MKFARIFLTCVLICGSAMAKKFPLAADPSVPAARGVVDVDRDKNGNTKFKIKVEHLAAPASLTPPKNVYVVWLQERGGTATAQGALKVNKNLDGSFEGVTSSKDFDVFITGEQDATPQSPSGTPILKATVQP